MAFGGIVAGLVSKQPALGQEPSNLPDEPVYFVRDVMTLLTKLGCNRTQCHGSFHGKGGLRLSTFGGEPDWDYDVLVKAEFGRRINKVEPAKSLLIQKVAGAMAHEGGQKVQPDSISCLSRGSPKAPAGETRICRSWLLSGPRPKSMWSRRGQRTH